MASTGEVSPLELVNAYTTLQSLGRYAEPILLTKVTDASGRVLEEHRAAFEETLPPPVAYLATSLMRSPLESLARLRRAPTRNVPFSRLTGAFRQIEGRVRSGNTDRRL